MRSPQQTFINNSIVMSCLAGCYRLASGCPHPGGWLVSDLDLPATYPGGPIWDTGFRNYFVIIGEDHPSIQCTLQV